MRSRLRWAKFMNEHISCEQQLLQTFQPIRRVDVRDDAALASVPGAKPREVALSARLRPLDLHDIGATLSQQHCRC